MTCQLSRPREHKLQELQTPEKTKETQLHMKVCVFLMYSNMS